jgi:hypothetical protein
MEDRDKIDSPLNPTTDELSEGWTSTHSNSKRSSSARDSNSVPKKNELEKQVNAGWDTPES